MHLLCARKWGTYVDGGSEICHLSLNIWSRDRDIKYKMKPGDKFLSTSVESWCQEKEEASIKKCEVQCGEWLEKSL